MRLRSDYIFTGRKEGHKKGSSKLWRTSDSKKPLPLEPSSALFQLSSSSSLAPEVRASLWITPYCIPKRALDSPANLRPFPYSLDRGPALLYSGRLSRQLRPPLPVSSQTLHAIALLVAWLSLSRQTTTSPGLSYGKSKCRSRGHATFWAPDTAPQGAGLRLRRGRSRLPLLHQEREASIRLYTQPQARIQ